MYSPQEVDEHFRVKTLSSMTLFMGLPLKFHDRLPEEFVGSTICGSIGFCVG